jgi:predicted MFS family arabinose efflux permease
MIAFGFHRPHHKISHHIDYTAVVLLTSATVALLLVLSWGGVQYAWSSPLIIGLAVAAAVLTAFLIRTEKRSEEPVLSPHIFHNRTVVIASSVMGLSFMALFGAFVFLPLFFQLVLGMDPAKAGLLLAPMTGGMILTSFLGGRIVSRTGRYKVLTVLGLGSATLSFIAMMIAAAAGGGMGVIETALIILGCGFGMVMPNLVVSIQNAVGPRELGAATATAAFFRQLGGTFGVAMSGAILTAVLQRLHAEKWSGIAKGGRSLMEQSIQQIAQLPAVQRELVKGAYRHAISTTFLMGSIVIAFAFFLVLYLPENPLKSARRNEADGGAGQS